MAAKLEPGAPAPNFSLPDHAGETLTLASFKGKALVLYFYPKDDTSGCTAEAIAFNGKAKDFAKAGAAILGVSPDPVKSHAKSTIFRSWPTKHDGISRNRSRSCSSDEREVDAARRLRDLGREHRCTGNQLFLYMGVERSTRARLIDKAGKIAKNADKFRNHGRR